ncbi:MAG TPA: hypothetical protein VHU84_05400 [Lacipirellulaceae bacterium]|jgi:hypothetical protein|nr:hypothetical protein [Lacipirellulaceae bacterium]
MPPKADTFVRSAPPATPAASGKLVIVGILMIALSAAVVSWWFRYFATHRAVQFWTPAGAELIRDAPLVTIRQSPHTSPRSASRTDIAATRAKFNSSETDVSQAHGLVHLRNALLEDQSYDWKAGEDSLPPSAMNGDNQYWWLTFSDPTTDTSLTLWLSSDFKLASRVDDTNEVQAVSTAPIAAGLREMFDEFTGNSAAAARPR